MNPAKQLLSRYLKIFPVKNSTHGFTLIELLVGIIIAFIVITPLMTFMISVIDNDHKEQAKSNEDQELSAALDYMKRDLQQAIYIYDADGINSIRNYLPYYQNPSALPSQYFPVLVFWKRQFVPNALTIGSGTNDTFVYSLVAYYLINDGNSSWSNQARIGRFQISNGYGTTPSEILSTEDQNFALFDLSLTSTTSGLKGKMDQWTTGTDKYPSQQVLPLVDYIDATPTGTGSNYNNPAPGSSSSTYAPSGCSTGMQMIPNFTSGATGSSAAPSTSTSPNANITGFYVCVDSTNTVAEIHLRANAFARLQENTLYDASNSNIATYFPQKSTRVRGIGYLYLNN